MTASAGTPAVSVILPVYNGGAQLALAVESIICQSFADWQLIILDDGSQDGAVAALSALGDPRIHVVCDGRNKGLSARLNEGVALARGRYIARMDHDDIAHPERLREQVEFLDTHPEVDLCGARCVAMDEKEGILGALPVATTHEQICARPWRSFHLAHPTWMGRAGWFRANPYAEPGPYRCEDQELLLRTHGFSRFAALPQSLLAYRVRANPKLAVLMRTRLALAQVQVDHFWRHRPRWWVALCVLAAVVRMGFDIARSITERRAPVRSAASVNENGDWRRIIGNLRRGLERPSVARD